MADQLPDKTAQDIVFQYHQEQWTHVRHHETQRSALTLQIMVLAISLGGAYFGKIQGSQPHFLRAGLSVLIMLLGVIGYFLVQDTNRATNSHIKRARAARVSLAFLEPFSNVSDDFPKIHRYFLIFHALIVVAGLLLLAMSCRT